MSLKLLDQLICVEEDSLWFRYRKYTSQEFESEIIKPHKLDVDQQLYVGDLLIGAIRETTYSVPYIYNGLLDRLLDVKAEIITKMLWEDDVLKQKITMKWPCLGNNLPGLIIYRDIYGSIRATFDYEDNENYSFRGGRGTGSGISYVYPREILINIVKFVYYLTKYFGQDIIRIYGVKTCVAVPQQPTIELKTAQAIPQQPTIELKMDVWETKINAENHLYLAYKNKIKAEQDYELALKQKQLAEQHYNKLWGKQDDC